MAYTFSSNNLPADGGISFFQLRAALLAAGWTSVRDSDGGTYSSSGTQITHSGAGAGGFGNALAWFELNAPAVGGIVRALCIQRTGAATTTFRVKTASSPFSGGTPSLVEVPSSADEVVQIGSGNDSIPIGLDWWVAVGGWRWHIACGGAAEFYSFYAVAITTASTSTWVGCCLDVMAANSFEPTDPDPAIWYWSSAAATAAVFLQSQNTSLTSSNPNRARGWLGVLTSIANNVGIGWWQLGTNADTYSVFGGTNPFTGNENLIDVGCYRDGNEPAPIGWKGKSTLFQWSGVIRTNTDRVTVSTPFDRIYINGFYMPWSGAPVLV
jgi:hypothetical protein